MTGPLHHSKVDYEYERETDLVPSQEVRLALGTALRMARMGSVVWLALIAGGGFFLVTRSIGLFVAYTVVLGIALFIVLFIKGETPRWRWGKD